MGNLSLLTLKEGFRARIIDIKDSSSNKDLKQLMNMGIVKGGIVEVINSQSSNLLMLRRENSTLCISKDLANNILVKII